jgi:hypothetical protein
VIHEDHAMMIRFDILPPGQGFQGSRPASEVYSLRRDKVPDGGAPKKG